MKFYNTWFVYRSHDEDYFHVSQGELYYLLYDRIIYSSVSEKTPVF